MSLKNQYSSRPTFRIIDGTTTSALALRFGGACGALDVNRNVLDTFVYSFFTDLLESSEEPEGKSPLERPRCRYEDNNKMYLKDVGTGKMWSRFIWLSIGTNGGLL
jgi:hypothetical protein